LIGPLSTPKGPSTGPDPSSPQVLRITPSFSSAVCAQIARRHFEAVRVLRDRARLTGSGDALPVHAWGGCFVGRDGRAQLEPTPEQCPRHCEHAPEVAAEEAAAAVAAAATDRWRAAAWAAAREQAAATAATKHVRTPRRPRRAQRLAKPGHDAPGVSRAQCKLVRQTSFAPCVLGRSFGCDPANGSMWVANCRGKFRCGSRLVHCGYPPGEQSAYNCSCTHAKSMDLGLSSRAPLQRAVIIWATAHLSFMYKPVVDSLVGGFKAARSQPLIVQGYGVLYMESPELVTLRDGDIFVWIGPIGSDKPPWHALSTQGVRTVYFQTEPADGCLLARSAPRELWEFSWHNFDACAPRLPAGLTLRYVPLGFTAPSESEGRAVAAADAAALGPQTEADLLFFGFPFYKSGRKRCYARLQRVLGGRLNATWSVWSEAAFEAFWAGTGRWVAHLNLHKECGHAQSSHNPVVFRTSLLLSRGATVISERAYYKDEHEYAGLVTFGAVDALPSILEQRLIRGSTSDSTRPLQTNASVAALYARRFAPQRIFARARIYTDLLGTNASAPLTEAEGEGEPSGAWPRMRVGTRAL